MSDDYDKIAELVRNGYSLDDALNRVAQTSILPPSGTVTASMIDTSTLGPVVDRIRTEDGAVATGTTLLPSDNTIPQSNEGDEYMTVSITPTSATNKLIIEAQAVISHSGTGYWMGACLFQDAIANALACTTAYDSIATSAQIMSIDYEMIAGTTSSITFRFRAGAGVAGTSTFNGSAGVQIFNGVMNSYLEVTEYLA